MKEVEKVNVSVIGSLIFFSYSEIFIKAKITKLKNLCKHKSKESQSMIWCESLSQSAVKEILCSIKDIYLIFV